MIVPPSSRAAAVSAATVGVIRARADAAGVDAGFLEALARVESGLRPDLRARTSTAAGLFQFIEATWLDLLHRHGAKHGFAAEVPTAVDTGKSGVSRFHFASPTHRQAALDLRFEPTASAALAAEYVKENGAMLGKLLARSPRPVDIYMAHFLGPSDARRFFTELDREPNAEASRLFPAPAAANRGVFFSGDGTPRSLRAIYETFASRLPNTAAEPKLAPVETIAVQETAPPAIAAVTAMAGNPGMSALEWRDAAAALLTLRLDWPDDAEDNEKSGYSLEAHILPATLVSGRNLDPPVTGIEHQRR